MIFRQLFDPESATYTYLLADPDTHEAILIDPVRDQVERDTKLLAELRLKLVYTLETHVHADHVTSSGVLRERLGSRSILSHKAGTACADLQVGDGDEIALGKIRLQVLETPGHTDGCLSYYESKSGKVFTGDALLIRGCGRTDFQQGNAHKLYHSVTQKLFTLGDEVEVYPGHDYRGFRSSTVGEERRFNPRLAGKSEEEFVQIMDALKLQAPKHIAEAVPANLACGIPALPTAIPMSSELQVERAWAPVQRSDDGVPELTAQWLHQHAAEVRIIDVREPSEFNDQLGHIQGSELLPLGDLARRMEELDPEQPIVVACRSGRRSAAAALQLEKSGFKRVASLRGGMLDWSASKLPASRDDGSRVSA